MEPLAPACIGQSEGSATVPAPASIRRSDNVAMAPELACGGQSEGVAMAQLEPVCNGQSEAVAPAFIGQLEGVAPVIGQYKVAATAPALVCIRRSEGVVMAPAPAFIG